MGNMNKKLFKKGHIKEKKRYYKQSKSNLGTDINIYQPFIKSVSNILSSHSDFLNLKATIKERIADMILTVNTQKLNLFPGLIIGEKTMLAANQPAARLIKKSATTDKKIGSRIYKRLTDCQLTVKIWSGDGVAIIIWEIIQNIWGIGER